MVVDPATIILKLLANDTGVTSQVAAKNIFYGMEPRSSDELQITAEFDLGFSEHSLRADHGSVIITVWIKDIEGGQISPLKTLREIADSIISVLNLKDRTLDDDGLAIYHIRKLDGQPEYDNSTRTWQLPLTFEVVYGPCP